MDPEDEADFEREYAKMMAESLESRKFDRKTLFDVPLPVRSKRDTPMATDTAPEAEEGEVETAPSTMAFSLLTKKGNRQQVVFPSRSSYPSPQTNKKLDENGCASFGLYFCGRYEDPTAGRERRTTAHQKPCSELRHARE